MATTGTFRIFLLSLGLSAAMLIPAAAKFEPAKAPLAFFDGASRSSGRITTLFVSKENFTARFEGRFDGNDLDLEEYFTFEDGEARQVWDLFAHRDGAISGTVRTETGDGTMREARRVTGEYDANRLILDYDGYAPNGSDRLLHFHHVLRPRPNGTMTNKVTVSKYYLPLATSRVTFYK